MTLRKSQEGENSAFSGLLTIQEFAKLCRTTSRTLRFYEEKGLFLPDSVDQFTKYRYYDPKRMRDFFQIKLLQDFAIPLADIKTIRSSDISEEMLHKKMQEIREQIEEKEKEYEFLRKIRHFLFADEDISSLFKKETIGPYILLSRKTMQGRYDKITDEITEMVSVANKLHIPLEGTQLTVYEAFNTYQPIQTSLELALVVKTNAIPSTALPEEYFFRLFPKTEITYYAYHGPYAYITLLYQKIQQSTNVGIDKKNKNMDIHLPVTKEMSEYDQVTKIAFYNPPA
jgi:DNA-binding transcriptional MerR regulator